jgi:hypothetical protein
MVGSGGDTYDPVCELPPGHVGRCMSSTAVDQHGLPGPVAYDLLNAPQRVLLARLARAWDADASERWVPRGGQRNTARALERRGLLCAYRDSFGLSVVGLQMGNYCNRIEREERDGQPSRHAVAGR